ncbi:MAG: MOSC domain-containing protein [Candidatus Rokubacteria bacterium]|nr:MOSC domain-containing protein [Candidatus Rokubacteria bacterium]
MIRALQAEGHPIAPGRIGENVTAQGLDWEAVVPGCHLLLGDGVLLRVTRYTNYARVLAPGAIRPGDGVRLLTETEAAALLGAART